MRAIEIRNRKDDAAALNDGSPQPARCREFAGCRSYIPRRSLRNCRRNLARHCCRCKKPGSPQFNFGSHSQHRLSNQTLINTPNSCQSEYAPKGEPSLFHMTTFRDSQPLSSPRASLADLIKWRFPPNSAVRTCYAEARLRGHGNTKAGFCVTH